jgi:hypothetical protein
MSVSEVMGLKWRMCLLQYHTVEMTECWLWNGCSRFLQNDGSRTASCGIMCWEVVGVRLYRTKPQTPCAASVWKVCFFCDCPSCGHFPDDCTSCVLVAVSKDLQNLCCYWQTSSCPPNCCECHVVLAAVCHNNMDVTVVWGENSHWSVYQTTCSAKRIL